MSNYKLETKNGETYIDGKIAQRCCNAFNPSIKGYIWCRFLMPVRICTACGSIHYLAYDFQKKIFIFIGQRVPINDIDIVLTEEISKWNTLQLEKHGFCNMHENKSITLFKLFKWVLQFELNRILKFVKLRK